MLQRLGLRLDEEDRENLTVIGEAIAASPAASSAAPWERNPTLTRTVKAGLRIAAAALRAGTVAPELLA